MKKKTKTGLEEAISESAVRSFRPFFARRVMRRIEALERPKGRPAASYETLIRFARPFFVGAAVLFIGLVFFNLQKARHLSVTSALALNDVTFEDVFIPTFSSIQQEAP
jgi:hypothetical protein